MWETTASSAIYKTGDQEVVTILTAVLEAKTLKLYVFSVLLILLNTNLFNIHCETSVRSDINHS